VKPADDFEPTPTPHGARRSLPHTPHLARALAALDWSDPRSVATCRRAALRHAETLQTWGIGAGLALRLLRSSAAIWAPETMEPCQRRELEHRLRFWVGTAYGVRWRTAPVADQPVPVDGTEEDAGTDAFDDAARARHDPSDPPPMRAD
jgi:hypothetical protein